MLVKQRTKNGYKQIDILKSLSSKTSTVHFTTQITNRTFQNKQLYLRRLKKRIIEGCYLSNFEEFSQTIKIQMCIVQEVIPFKNLRVRIRKKNVRGNYTKSVYALKFFHYCTILLTICTEILGFRIPGKLQCNNMRLSQFFHNILNH